MDDFLTRLIYGQYTSSDTFNVPVHSGGQEPIVHAAATCAQLLDEVAASSASSNAMGTVVEGPTDGRFFIADVDVTMAHRIASTAQENSTKRPSPIS